MSESSSRREAWLPVYESSVSSSLCEGSGVEERVTVDFRESLKKKEIGSLP